MQTDLNFNVTFSGNALHIAGSPMTVEIFSTKGNKLMAVDNVSGTLSLAKLPVGMYVAKVRGNGTNMVRAIQIK